MTRKPAVVVVLNLPGDIARLELGSIVDLERFERMAKSCAERATGVPGRQDENQSSDHIFLSLETIRSLASCLAIQSQTKRGGEEHIPEPLLINTIPSVHHHLVRTSFNCTSPA